jgi:hypothetical protein
MSYEDLLKVNEVGFDEAFLFDSDVLSNRLETSLQTGLENEHTHTRSHTDTHTITHTLKSHVISMQSVRNSGNQISN